MHFNRFEPIHITVPGSPDDPRNDRPMPPGVILHYAPALHPDDVDVVDGIRVTSVSRTLIDCAEDASELELRAMFARAYELGILDLDAVDASLPAWSGGRRCRWCARWWRTSARGRRTDPLRGGHPAGAVRPARARDGVGAA